MTGHLTLLLTSPRVAPGLLTREAWRALDAADRRYARPEDPQARAVRDAGLDLLAPPDDVAAVGRLLVGEAAGGASVVWVGSADGDPGLTDVVATEVSRRAGPPDVEVLLGSYDVPGSRLLDLVAVMDRLRSPGGCPWDREQTHTSLVPYLVEEAYEAAEAIEEGDRDHMVEELGDVLLQVVFHARVAQEDPEAPFDVDDVAAAIVTKLVRRHPHVFADGEAHSPADVQASWEVIKRAERGTDGDHGPLAGIPVGMPPLARAAKVLSRLRRRGLADLMDDVDTGTPGGRLLALVAELTAAGVDPEAALRSALRDLAERVGPEPGGG